MGLIDKIKNLVGAKKERAPNLLKPRTEKNKVKKKYLATIYNKKLDRTYTFETDLDVAGLQAAWDKSNDTDTEVLEHKNNV